MGGRDDQCTADWRTVEVHMITRPPRDSSLSLRHCSPNQRCVEVQGTLGELRIPPNPSPSHSIRFLGDPIAGAVAVAP